MLDGEHLDAAFVATPPHINAQRSAGGRAQHAAPLRLGPYPPLSE
jgi:hypothetical protein